MRRRMSESLEGVLGRVSYGKHLDKIQNELKTILSEMGPGKSAKDAGIYVDRIQSVFKSETEALAKELGLQGNPVMVYMVATSVLSTAWVAFALRREASDLSKSPEDRLSTIEMLDGLGNALSAVVNSASSYADGYPQAGATAAQQGQQDDSE